MNNNDSKKEHTEKCINCDIDTGVPVDLHVDYRNYYVEGAGQLCKECFSAMYNKQYVYMS